MKLFTIAAAAAMLAAFAVMPASAQSPVKNAPPKDRLTVQLKGGDVVIQLFPSVAPKAVARLETLAKEGAYDNVAFHRVIAGFMAQTGDVQYGDMKDGYSKERVGTGGSKLPDLPAEFSSIPFTRGTVGMARAQDPNSANSQFFIMFADGSFLNGKYTVVGQVIKGMDLVDKIKQGDEANNGAVSDPDRMIKVTVGG